MDTAETKEEVVGTASVGQLEAIEAAAGHSVSPMRAAARRFMRDKRAVLCLAVILFIAIGSFVFPPIYQHLGPTLPPTQHGGAPVTPEQYHDPIRIAISQATDAPGTFFPLGPNSLVHPFGTDGLGRDMLSRMMAGVNVSIELALLVEVLDIGLGVLLGALAGWYGGMLGMGLDRFTDIVFAFPALLLIILMGASLGPIFDAHLPSSVSRMAMLTLAIGLLAWPLMMRQVRGQTIQLKEQQYVEAARTAGTSNAKIIMRHVVPNLMNVVVVIATLDILATIIGEAGISLIGVGIQPPAASLGLMISDARPQLYATWTELFWPCFVLVVLVVCFSFVGDGVRDAFDPRTKD